MPIDALQVVNTASYRAGNDVVNQQQLNSQLVTERKQEQERVLQSDQSSRTNSDDQRSAREAEQQRVAADVSRQRADGLGRFLDVTA